MNTPTPPPPPNEPSDAALLTKEAAWAAGEMAAGATIGWFIFGPIGAVAGALAGSILYRATRTS